MRGTGAQDQQQLSQREMRWKENKHFLDNIPLGFACQMGWMPVDEEAAASSGVSLFLLVCQTPVLDKHKNGEKMNVWWGFLVALFV